MEKCQTHGRKICSEQSVCDAIGLAWRSNKDTQTVVSALIKQAKKLPSEIAFPMARLEPSEGRVLASAFSLRELNSDSLRQE